LQPCLEKYRGRFLFQQFGSIFSFCCTGLQRVACGDDIRTGNMQRFARFHREMLDRGVYLPPSGYEVGFISTAHTDDDLLRTADAVQQSLAAVMG